MALTQVRVKLGDTWTNLTYNSATGRYEGYITPPGTSIHQPGGYYSLTAEATNQSGETASISGAQLPSLRIVVRETQAPTLTLVSPPAGWLTANSPTFVFRAQDEAGGSGINPASAQAAIDGASVPCTVSQAGEVYTLTFSSSSLSEGPHTVTAAISDYDGNQATASAAYTVDTVPPELRVDKPYLRCVVDEETVVIAGYAADLVSPNITVTIGGQPVEVAEGHFSATRGLSVGENHIPIKAVDAAGNQTTAEVYMIRLITDRAAGSPNQLLELVKRPLWEWTAQELAWYNGAVIRGAYNKEDVNRVGAAVRYLSAALEQRGYLPVPNPPKTDWTQLDAPADTQMEAYRQNVDYIREAQGTPIPEIPETIRHLDTKGANQIEKALVEADEVFPRYFTWTAGELTAGGM